MIQSDHLADGTDAAGRGLAVAIRIGPDGRVYFHDIPPDMVAVALALSPEDPLMKRRAEIADRFGQERAR
jgi:hypothetical protein